MQEDEQQIAAGGVLYRRAGCLLVPFLPVKAAGALIVTTKRLVFEPMLFYKLVTRRFAISLEEVSEVESSGSSVEFSLMNFVSIGKALTIKLKNGVVYTFRSVEADGLAEVINLALRRFRSRGDGE